MPRRFIYYGSPVSRIPSYGNCPPNFALTQKHRQSRSIIYNHSALLVIFIDHSQASRMAKIAGTPPARGGRSSRRTSIDEYILDPGGVLARIPLAQVGGEGPSVTAPSSISLPSKSYRPITRPLPILILNLFRVTFCYGIFDV